MSYNTIESELRQLLEQITQWRRQESLSRIEKDAALSRMQALYLHLLQLPCSLCEQTEYEITKISGSGSHSEKITEPNAVVAQQTSPNLEPEMTNDLSGGQQNTGSVTEVAPVSDVALPIQPKGEMNSASNSEQDEAVHFQSDANELRLFGQPLTATDRQKLIDTLFHGDEKRFETEVARLEQMDSFEDALVHISETYRWIPENPATGRFIELLESHFDSL